MLWMRETAEGVLFKVAIQPRGSKNEIVGLYGDAVKIRLTAPPVEGAANKMCIRFLAKRLHVSRSSIQIVQGLRSRSKTILVQSVKTKDVEGLLLDP